MHSKGFFFCDGSHYVFEKGRCLTMCDVNEFGLIRCKFVFAKQIAYTPSKSRCAFCFIDIASVEPFIVLEAWLKLIKSAHSKIRVDKQTLVNIWPTKCKPCLNLACVMMWNSVHRYLPFERAFELQRCNGVILADEIPVGAACHFLIKRMAFFKIEWKHCGQRRRLSASFQSIYVLLAQIISPKHRQRYISGCVIFFMKQALSGFKWRLSH